MPPTVFISYSRRDDSWKDRLARQLGVLEREGLLKSWHDGLIQPGVDWLPAIEAAMAEARVAVFIISADFLNSDFIRRNEIPALMQRRQMAGLRVIPVIARPCPWKKVLWLAAIQARPHNGKTLAGLGGVKAEEVLSDLAEEILTLVEGVPSSLPRESMPGAAPAAAPGATPPTDVPQEPAPEGPRRRTEIAGRGKAARDAHVGDDLDPLVPTELVQFEEPIVALDILPQSRGLVVCHPHGARVLASWKPSSGDKQFKFDCAEATSCALSEDGELLAVADCFAEMAVYRLRDWGKVHSLRRTASKKEIRRFRAIGLRENSFEYGELAFSPDGRRLAACRQVASRDQDRIIYPHSIDPMDEPVDIYDLNGEFKYPLATGGSSPVVCFSRDSRRVLVGLDYDQDDNLAVYDAEDGTQSYSMYLNGFVRCIKAHPDGKQAIVSLAGGDRTAIRFLSIASGRELAALSYLAIPDDGRYPCTESLCIDSAGRYLVSAHNCGVLRLWDTRSYSLLLTWSTNPGGLWVSGLRFSSDDAYLFATLKRFPYEETSATLAVMRMADLFKRVQMNQSMGSWLHREEAR